MSHATAKKVFIQIESVAEQQEHLKQQRKTLKVLQGVGTDKENLVGRPELDKLSRLKASATESTLASTEYAKRKKVESRAVHTQTSPVKQQQQQTITAEDLTSDAKPGEHYWERLAEKRREALEETLTENRHLHERIEGLEAELSTSRQELEQTQHLVAVLTEMLEENEEKAEEEKSDDVTDVESAAETAASSEKDKDDNDEAKN